MDIKIYDAIERLLEAVDTLLDQEEGMMESLQDLSNARDSLYVLMNREEDTPSASELEDEGYSVTPIGEEQ